jgi:parallel beta-helix repeat protein
MMRPTLKIRVEGRFDILERSLVTGQVSTYKYKFEVYGILNVAKSIVQYMWGDLANPTAPSGIQLHPTSKATITNSIVQNGWRSQIYVFGGASPTITNTKIIGHRYYGFAGIYCAQDSAVVATGNTITNCDYGIYAVKSSSIITGNTITGVKNAGSMLPV